LAEFRAALKSCREQQQFNFQQAATRAGITAERWSHIERGYEVKGELHIPARPKRRTVINMAMAVGMDKEEALRLAGMAPLSVSETRSSVDPRKEITELLPMLSASRLRALLDTARTMLDADAPAADQAAGDPADEVIVLGPHKKIENHQNQRDDAGNGGQV
jgi:transcriptional regulator with XRE-family HTH domain